MYGNCILELLLLLLSEMEKFLENCIENPEEIVGKFFCEKVCC